MFGRYQRCCCMNNNCENMQNDTLETACQNMNCCNNNMYNENCSCGFNDDYTSVFPEDPMLAQSYVPIQFMDKTFKPDVGLKMGTIFPELVSPYKPCQSMEVNRYLAATNKIGEGCNK